MRSRINDNRISGMKDRVTLHYSLEINFAELIDWNTTKPFQKSRSCSSLDKFQVEREEQGLMDLVKWDRARRPAASCGVLRGRVLACAVVCPSAMSSSPVYSIGVSSVHTHSSDVPMYPPNQ